MIKIISIFFFCLLIFFSLSCEDKNKDNNKKNQDELFTLSGTVTSSKGNPLSGITIKLSNENINALDTSDGAGNYLIASLSTGSYLLIATSNVKDVFSGIVQINASRIYNITIDDDILNPNGTLSGKITYYDSTSAVQIKITLIKQDKPYSGDNIIDTSDSNGNYSFGGLYNGTYKIQLDKLHKDTKIYGEIHIGAPNKVHNIIIPEDWFW